MKRSEINQILANAKVFLSEKQFILPPWAYWSVEDWNLNRKNTLEIIDNMLGEILPTLARAIFTNVACFFSLSAMATNETGNSFSSDIAFRESFTNEIQQVFTKLLGYNHQTDKPIINWFIGKMFN